MEKTNYWNGALHFVNAERKDYDGTITPVTIHGRAHYCCHFVAICQGNPVRMSSFQETVERAENFMAERGYVPNVHPAVYPDNPKRKERLFSIGGKSVCWDAAPMEFRKEYFPVYFDQFGRDFFPYVPAGE